MSAVNRDVELRRGQARLEGELDRLRRRLDDTVESAVEEMRKGVDEPLRKALTHARDAHQALLRDTGLDALIHPVAAEAGSADEDPATVPPPSWDALRAYREGLGSRVLDPLDKALAHTLPADRLEDVWTGFQGRLAEIHRGSPVHVDRPEPDGLYRRAPGDGPLTTAGKLAVRGTRGLARALAAPFRGLATLVGSKPEPRPLRPQRVPVHTLARDRLRGAEPSAWADLGDALLRHHAGPLAHLERALATFNRAWYPVELQLQEPGDILDATVAARLEHILSQATPPPDEAGETGESGSDADDGAMDDNGGEDGADELGEDESDGGAGELGEDEPDAGAEEPGGDDPDVGAGEDEDAGTDPETPGEKALRTLVEAVSEVEAALARAAGAPEPEELYGRIREAGTETWEGFLDAVNRADSFHAPRDEASRTRAFHRAVARYESRVGRWQAWYAAARARVHLSGLLVVLRNHWDEAHGDLVNGVGQEGLLDLADEWLHARDHLLALHQEAVASEDLTPKAIAERPREVAATVDRWLEVARRELRDHLVEPMERHQAVEVIARIADDASGDLSRTSSRLPETVELNLPQVDPDRVTPGVPRRAVALREIVSETLDAFRIEAIRTSPAPLLAVLEEAATECAKIPGVVEYNLTTARDEILSEDHESRAPEEDRAAREGTGTDQATSVGVEEGHEEAPSWEEEVEELTVQGLARTAQGVETLLSLFGPAWTGFMRTVHETLPPTFGEVHGRVVGEGIVREQIQGIRAFFRRKGRLGWNEVREAAGSGVTYLKKTWRRLRPRVRSLLRLGRIAVGAPASSGDEERALEVLRTIPELVAPLPLVYRRLFAFQPVTDPTLLAGREEELAWFADRYAGWQADRPAPAVVVAPPGAGVTSLYNVLDADLLRDMDTARVEFDRRETEEEQLAARLAECLCIPDFSGNLRELGGEVMAREAEPRCRSVFLEGLEYVQFRGPGGGRLLASLLAFLGHTASRIFWVCSISEAAWSLMQVRSPVTASMVAVLKLEPLTREQIESSILRRHRRSGLPLVFLPPRDLNPLKARALKRARSQEDRQAILQGDFFDRIYRLSHASQAMADVLWLRSLDMEAREGQVLIRACRPIRFAFLETLTSEMDFTLMALLEHGSLTPEECRQVLQLPEHAILGIFEALRSRMLLQDVVDEYTIPRPVEELDPQASYRIPQILGMAVNERLRSLNILH